jgi:hypothetical protein
MSATREKLLLRLNEIKSLISKNSLLLEQDSDLQTEMLKIESQLEKFPSTTAGNKLNILKD